MAVNSHSAVLPEKRSNEASRLDAQGIVAGLLGAATIAIWFLVVDLISGRPFHTPTALGAALFQTGLGIGSSASSFGLVMMFTWVHGLVFMVIGGAASRLLGLAEHHPNAGFGILLLFVIFMYGFVAACMIVAEPVLRSLDVPAIFVGNLLASVVMGAFFWRCHPRLKILP